MSSTKTGETGSFRLIFKFLSSTSETISTKYFELKLTVISSAVKFDLTTSFPSPEFVLLTENFILSLANTNLTPSLRSSETVITLSIAWTKSVELTVNILSLSTGTTFL